MSHDRDVDLYDSHYTSIRADVQKAIRQDTYGEDLGQTSWVTAAELRELLTWLDLRPGSELLEVACGSGGASALIAQETGASVTGIDINPQAIRAAGERPAGTGGTLRFVHADADKVLPFPESSFDAVYCNDAMNHLLNRQTVLDEWFRVLRPGGAALFTDPVVVTGPITSADMRARSSIGEYLFVPAGENERFLERAGFVIERVENRTEATAGVSARWHAARQARRDVLVQMEGEDGFAGLQHFLDAVHRLSAEGRLSRFLYLARKPA